MSVYDINGDVLEALYNKNEASLTHAYDINGTEIFSGWNQTTLSYDTNFLITSAWLENAATQRDAVKALYQASEDAIPFFIMTDGHGRYNEGNKGCHNLAESTMKYIANIQLGDYASYYNNGNDPASHARTSAGISNYLTVMGNHEFLRADTSDPIADMPTMIASYTPSNAVLGSSTYGYYKVLDNDHNVKWMVTQPYIPNDSASSGFSVKFTSDQWEWIIDELEADDGYDIVFLNHAPYNGTYTRIGDSNTHTHDYPTFNIAPLLADKKLKRSGTLTDSDGNVHSYDFSNSDTDVLCTLHGHIHYREYMTKEQYGYPAYVGEDFTGVGDSCYGLIDRDNGKLYIYGFTRSSVYDPLVLDL